METVAGNGGSTREWDLRVSILSFLKKKNKYISVFNKYLRYNMVKNSKLGRFKVELKNAYWTSEPYYKASYAFVNSGDENGRR